MTVSHKQNQKPPSRYPTNIALTVAKPKTPSPPHGRTVVGPLLSRLRETPPAVVIPATELMLPPDATPGGVYLAGADAIGRAAESLRALHETGRAGSEAALCVLDTGNALVADWVRNRIYHVELDMHDRPPVAPSTEMASSLIGAAWLEVRRSSWATAVNLRDPEFASALKAAQQYVVWLGLRLQDATIGGREVTPEQAR
jgi:hypothetical protein